MSLFERPSAGQAGDNEPFTQVRRRNPAAVVGAVLSVVPLVGLVLSVIGLVWSRKRGGVGRIAAVVGIVLSVLFGGAETYVGTTAPLFDAGCLGANASASRLRAIQAAPGGNLTVLASELDSIHADLDAAANEAGSTQIRTKLQLVAGDVQTLGNDFTTAEKSGDTTRLLGDQTKLQTDGDAADSYCHSL